MSDDEVLVRMHATSIKPIDVKKHSGAAKSHMPLEFPAILGRDLSGEVIETGRNVQGFPKGVHIAECQYLRSATASDRHMHKAEQPS